VSGFVEFADQVDLEDKTGTAGAGDNMVIAMTIPA
jgi:hypothetical protein